MNPKRIALFLLAGAMLISNASAATIIVCPSGCVYSSIQAAIDAASPSDTIFVFSGTYYENVIVNKKLSLKGIDTGGGNPVVDAGGIGSTIKLSADEIILSGFNATRGGVIESGEQSDAGIKVTSNNNILIDNIANNNGNNGIFLYNSNNNNLYNNTASSNKNRYGILLAYSSNNTLTRNYANENGYYGIQLVQSSNNNTLIGNIVKYNPHYGIVLAFSSNDNVLDGNKMNNNGWGIHFYLSNNNILINNDITNNGNTGIWLVSSNNNKFYNNNLINNNNAISTSTTIWDNGTIGNHWSNFDEPSEDCYDIDNNGICDSAYSVPGGSMDNFPLVTWSAPPPIPIPIPAIASLIFMVTDNNTGQPIANAIVHLKSKYNGKTNENGFITFEVPLGNYNYMVHKERYKKVDGMVSVAEDTIIFVRLIPQR